MVASSPRVTRDPVEMLKLARTITSFFVGRVLNMCILGTSLSCRKVYKCPRGQIALSSKRKKKTLWISMSNILIVSSPSKARCLRCIKLEVDSWPKLKIIRILTWWYLIANTVKNSMCIFARKQRHFFSRKRTLGNSVFCEWYSLRVIEMYQASFTFILFFLL